jgi:aminoglycoside phosphotransferase (APT) family kinase protein
MRAATADTDDTRAVDLDRLDRFMAAAMLGDEAAPVSRHQLSGGMSQVTVIYSPAQPGGAPAPDADKLVVRVAPLQGPLEPYDAVAEATLMTTVAGFGIPVPEVALIERTGDAIGRPFYATKFVPGAMSAEGGFGPEAQHDKMAETYVNQLVAVHAVPTEVRGQNGISLSELLSPLPQKTPEAVLERWTRALEERHVRIPAYQQFLRDWLLLRMPQDDGSRALVHGDYRLANMLWTTDSEIAAAMDWEEAGLGDPYSDLAWTLMGTFDDSDDVLGLGSRGWLLDRYATLAGIDLDHQRLLWWEVASGWSLLCMNARACSLIADGPNRDIRPLLYCYLNRRIAGGPLRKIQTYERGRS